MAGAEIKLTSIQQRALNKLKKLNDWECAYSLKESMATLDALVRKGLLKKRGAGKVGSMFEPRVVIEYKVR